MQRKNSILKRRRAFAIIMAMAVIVVIGTIMALSLALTTQTAKRTTDIYLYEQSVLLAKSAAELALEQIAANPICDPANAASLSLSNINFLHDGIYNINVDMRYFLPPNLDANGDGIVDYQCANTLPNTPYSIPTSIGPRGHLYGTVMLDVTVSVNDATITSEPITYFKRTVQKL